MSFDLDKFTPEPSVELLNLGKKTDLLNLAKHYKLSEIKSSMGKHEIKNILVQYFVDEGIFNENALSLIVDVQSFSSSKNCSLIEFFSPTFLLISNYNTTLYLNPATNKHVF